MISGSSPELWGIVNVTPDSFSDGGRYFDLELAIAKADMLSEQGADVIDVGGESTRPGASRVDAEEEARRVVPVVASLAKNGTVVSVDTMRASTARLALDVGAKIVNDVSGGLADKAMLATVASSDADYVMMHWRAHSATMQDHAEYFDVVAEVVEELTNRLVAAEQAGISSDRIILDPGLGFAKSSAHNWSILQDLSAFSIANSRLLLGASRKRFIGELMTEEHKPEDRDALSAVLGVLAAEAGISALRVHNVKIHREALDLWQAFNKGTDL